MQSIGFFTSVIKIFLDNFWNNSRNFTSSGGLSRDYYWGGWYTKNSWFSRFFKNISENFWYFLREICFGSINISGSCDKHQNFEYGFPSYPAKRSPVFGLFWRCWVYFELFVLAQAFSLEHWFLLPEICSMYIHSRVVRALSWNQALSLKSIQWRPDFRNKCRFRLYSPERLETWSLFR